MNKRILLTGTSGFLGYNFLITALKNGFYVTDILRKKNINNRKLKNLKNKYKRYKSLYFSNLKNLKIIKKKKFDFFINFATFYKDDNSDKNFIKFVNSNIIFPSVILNNISEKIKVVINIGSMQEYCNDNKYSPKNLYAATKMAYEKIVDFYKSKNTNVKFFFIKLFDTFAENDTRAKLLPTIIKNYKKNKVILLQNKNISLNIVHFNNVNDLIFSLLKKKIKKNLVLKNNKNTNIFKLLSKINKKLKKKIKFKIKNLKENCKIFNQYKDLKIINTKYNIEKDFFTLLMKYSK